MEISELNGVQVPVKVLELAAANPMVNDLLQRATSIDFKQQGFDLEVALRHAMWDYALTLQIGLGPLKMEQRCQRASRRAAEETGTPIPPPFNPETHSPAAHARKLIAALELSPVDVANAIGLDREETNLVLYRGKKLDPQRRQALVELLKVRSPQYARSKRQLTQMVEQKKSAAANKLAEELQRTITEAAGRKPLPLGKAGKPVRPVTACH